MKSPLTHLSIQARIFVIIAPAATLMLLIVLAIGSFRVSSVLELEIQNRVNASAENISKQVATKLKSTISAVDAVAANDIVIHGIVDQEHRVSTLQSYFRSLRIPGPSKQQITMTDYKGRRIASTKSDASEFVGAHWFDHVMSGGRFVSIDQNEFMVAVPVLYSNRAEGVLVAQLDAKRLLADQIRISEFQAAVFHIDNTVICTTNPNFVNESSSLNTIGHSLAASANIDEVAGLSVSHFESKESAFEAARTVRTSQTLQLLILLSLLMFAIWLAARLATEPITELIRKIGRVEETADLGIRLPEDGPKEAMQLASGFNAMLEKLQHTTVSQEQFRVSEERLALAIKGAKDGLWDWNTIDNTVWYAPQYKQMLGYNDHEFPNELASFKSHLHPDDVDATFEAVDLHIETSAVYDVEHRLRSKSGDYRWFRARGAAIRDDAGNIVRMTGTMQDISEVKQYQEELERSNHDLEQFAFIASHDLQEPLRKVASFCSLLREEYSEVLGENGNTYVDFAVDGALRMRSLVQDLLAYSTIGSESEEKTTVSVETALECAVSNLSSAIEESNAELTHDPLPKVVAREREIAQLLQNLIGNSIKYRSEEKPKIHVGVQAEENDWVFSITDNGIGISPEFREQVFGIFKRLHTREKFAGTGIGLSICQRVVEKLGGKIWVDEHSDQGTKICFSIPIQKSSSTTTRIKNEPVPIEQPA